VIRSGHLRPVDQERASAASRSGAGICGQSIRSGHLLPVDQPRFVNVFNGLARLIDRPVGQPRFVNVFNGLAFSTRTRHFSEKSPQMDRKKPIPEKTETPEKTDQVSTRPAPEKTQR
jgi:hypothetical protein